MHLTLLRPSDQRRMPWKNGGGTTAEIFLEPLADNAPGGFLFRLSLATIERDGPFSIFPGYDRILLLLSGDGMELDFGTEGVLRVARPKTDAHFPGEWAANCTLRNGPVQVLNLIFDRAHVKGVARLLVVGHEGQIVALCGQTALLYVLWGEASVDREVLTLSTGDTLRVDTPKSLFLRALSQPEAAVYIIEIH